MAIQRNGKRFKAVVWVRGERVAIKTFPTKQAAIAWHDHVHDLYTAGKASEIRAAHTTLADAVGAYREAYMAQHLREQSRQVREFKLRYIEQAPIAEAKMRDLTPQDVDRWLDWLRLQETGSRAGRIGFREELRTLRAICHWYRNYRDHCFVVPVLPRHSKVVNQAYKAAAARRSLRFMEVAEIERWLQWLSEKKPPVYGRLASFLLLTGCRVGEAAGLFWDCIDLTAGTAHIKRTAWWDHHGARLPHLFEGAKTEGSIGLVKLPAPLVEMLCEMREEIDWIDRRPVFCAPQATPELAPLERYLVHYRLVQSAFNAGFKALDLPYSATHICRHSFASLGLRVTGGDLTALQVSLRHRSRRQTEHYAKALASYESRVGEELGKLIEMPRTKIAPQSM